MNYKFKNLTKKYFFIPIIVSSVFGSNGYCSFLRPADVLIILKQVRSSPEPFDEARTVEDGRDVYCIPLRSFFYYRKSESSDFRLIRQPSLKCDHHVRI